MEDTMKYNIKCPLTDLIYLSPVVADDGYIYEEMAIKYWLDMENTSPITGEPMNKDLMAVKQYKLIIDNYLNKYPDQVENRFINKKPYYLFKDQFINLLLENKFNELTIFTDILLTDYVNNNITIAEYLFTHQLTDKSTDKLSDESIDIIKTIIDNSVDYDSFDDSGYKPIHIACKYSNQYIIKHLIDKNIDINTVDVKGNKPIHYLVIHQNDYKLVIDYFVNNDNANEEVYNKHGMLPIHLVCQQLEDWESMEIFLKNNCNLEATSYEKLKPIHYVLKCARNANVIKKFIDLNIELNTEVNIGNKIITPEQLVYQNNYLNKKEKQEIVHYYLTKIFRIPEIVEDYIDSHNILNTSYVNTIETIESIESIEPKIIENKYNMINDYV